MQGCSKLGILIDTLMRGRQAVLPKPSERSFLLGNIFYGRTRLQPQRDTHSKSILYELRPGPPLSEAKKSSVGDIDSKSKQLSSSSCNENIEENINHANVTPPVLPKNQEPYSSSDEISNASSCDLRVLAVGMNLSSHFEDKGSNQDCALKLSPLEDPIPDEQEQ